MHRLHAGTLAVLLASASTGALADATATARLSGFSFQLVDLDPGDGIMPSIDLSGFGGGQASASGDDGYVQDVASSVFGPAQASSGGTLTSASAAIVGDLLAGGTANAQSAATDGFARGQDVVGTLGATPSFVLSPHTELVMAATADVSATYTPAVGSQGSSEAAVELGISGPAPGYPFSHDYVDVTPDDADPGTLSAHRDLSVSFSNTTDAAAEGEFSVYVYAVSEESLATPEPAGGSLMLLGLGGLALVARRRRCRPRDGKS